MTRGCAYVLLAQLGRARHSMLINKNLANFPSEPKHGQCHYAFAIHIVVENGIASVTEFIHAVTRSEMALYAEKKIFFCSFKY